VPNGTDSDSIRRLALDVRSKLPASQPAVVALIGTPADRPVVVIAVNEAGRGFGLSAGPLVAGAAKALGGGYPLGATIGLAPLFTSAARHSDTFSAEPRAALLALFVLRCVEEQGLVEHAATLGAAMLKRLRQKLERIEQVGEVRGLGLMQGIEFVEDSRTKRPATELRNRVVKNCVFKQRLWILGAGRSSIRLLPALIMDEEQANEAIDRLERAIAEEIGALGRTQIAVSAAR